MVEQSLKDYVEKLLPLMNLWGWTIEIEVSNEEADNLAEINAVPESHLAVITIKPSFWKLSVAEQRQTLVHELVHCHTNRLTDRVQALIEQALPKKLWGGLEAALSLDLEELTDTLAHIIAPHMPTWVSEDAKRLNQTPNPVVSAPPANIDVANRKVP